jgi:hypothetical protein
VEPTLEESVIDDTQMINDDNNILEKNSSGKEIDEVESVNEEDTSVLLEGKMFNH